jgi:hypothetical protein
MESDCLGSNPVSVPNSFKCKTPRKLPKVYYMLNNCPSLLLLSCRPRTDPQSSAPLTPEFTESRKSLYLFICAWSLIAEMSIRHRKLKENSIYNKKRLILTVLRGRYTRGHFTPQLCGVRTIRVTIWESWDLGRWNDLHCVTQVVGGQRKTHAQLGLRLYCTTFSPALLWQSWVPALGPGT